MKNYGRYVTGVLFLIAALVLIILGFNFIRNIFSDDKKGQPQTQNLQKVNLIESAQKGDPVRYTIQGAIQGEEQFRSIRITVDRNNRTAEVLQGFNYQVIKSQQTPNTQPAYEAFVKAINGAGFTNQISPLGRGDEAQSCPLGQRYSYEIAPDSANHFRTWYTNCNRTTGTFTGNNTLVRTLFQRQIPEYGDFTRDIRLNP
jgi:hypothetical protein